ncbi:MULTISPECIES: aminotransferase class I/II-fold pyridoxal phosphate-dependent enzyme [unclassified Sinorhizobium]|uniref:trans-sulfuration enzyme family protein n=1 Tax=unclassified Sinorhizobium TaxID=2613772 RepID=UPI0024C28C9F|nr:MULTISPECIES: aminotransferase class I/II-fold pyridoxal phosphate-dependent enzyme [unclassified Sinorhizobium]MDK1376788.1 aminotransferase class I/II-fold pyridoxal phosphate-dependent enzyme [Sinorhizobium sp. 6-70]MDK1479559.1 aminotransferase class I/II-fold pyridoxal phosphate-dependent enzyme [Sinorhizobium sp. 6-117]
MKDLTQCVVTPDVDMDGFEALGAATYRGSTIVFKNAEAYRTRGERGHQGYTYGLYGTPTTRTLEAKLTALEQGARTFLVPSGQASNSVAMLSFLSSGDKVLIADNSYPPVRDFANRDLARFGVEIAYYDPVAVEDLEKQIDARTKIVWCESPGSTTMEIQDLPKIADIAHRHGALVGCDNTWATPLNYKPLTLGADIVTEALTKYVSGHSDVLMGSITVRAEEHILPLRATLGRLGIGVSPDDATLVLRGMETLGVRLKHAAAGAAEIIALIQQHPLVDRVLYPSLLDFPGHDIWKRDFLGASGVFSVVLKPEATKHAAVALDVLRTFAIGASWGGTRSLIAPMPVKQNRSASQWDGEDLVLRISIGLEDLGDLKADIEAFLADITERCAPARVSKAS